ncbi:MAG: hypothetical protein JWL95_346 [Gemmatimonadetes bacterium]|nr:hypothetical protein [Gemmatimonadota bacterium]
MLSPEAARHRVWVPEFSVATAEQPCGRANSLAELACPPRRARPTGETGDVAARIARTLKENPGADALQATALLDLLSGDTSGKVIERSISYLEMSTRLEPTYERFTDLAAARLAHASQRGGAQALVEGLDAACRALDMRPAGPAALYDRSLALDLLGLDLGAAKSWREYLTIDSTSVRATEARRRLRDLALLAPPAAPEPGAPLEAYRRFAGATPGDAQLLAWDRLLPAWGRSALRGDSVAALSRLKEADAVATQLERNGRDSSAGSAVRAIVAARADARRLRVIAGGHERFAEAQEHAHVNSYALADDTYRAILASNPGSPALEARVALAHANALIYARHTDSALAVSERFLRAHQNGAAPYLHGRAHWYAGVVLLRKGRTEAGLRRIASARSYFERSGDDEDVAGTSTIESEVFFQSGDPMAGYDRGLAALHLLRGRPASLWRHNGLVTLSRAATRAGLTAASRIIEDEDIAGAERGTRVVSVVEAKVAQARTGLRRGRTAQARQLLDAVRGEIAAVRDTTMRAQLYRDLNLATAEALLPERPDSAATLLTSTLAVDRPLNYPIKLMPSLIARAAVYVRLGRPEDAERDLAEAAGRFNSERSAIRSAVLQEGITTLARSVYDSLVTLRLREGNRGGALAALEQSRLAFSAYRSHEHASTQLPKSGSIVEFALIGNTLLSWTLGPRDTFFQSTPVDRRELRMRIERVRTELEIGADEERLRLDLSQLYHLLVAPLASHLVGDRLRIIVDGELAGVPFAALWNGETRRYLAEDFATNVAPSLSRARTPEPAPFYGVATIVGNPSLAGSAYARLPALPGADAEVRITQTLYPRVRVIQGNDVDSASTASAFAGSELVHFAGHAIIDDVQPWRSLLAVRPGGLSATAIAGMDLRRVRLVVLSACETMRAPGGETGGFAGLTDAFLAAGAGAVVGTLWRVRDEDAQQLMVAFHRDYRWNGDGASALRAAQVALLREGQPPAVWAAFRYTGR